MVYSDLGMPRRKTVIEAVLALGGEGILRRWGMRVFILEEWICWGLASHESRRWGCGALDRKRTAVLNRPGISATHNSRISASSATHGRNFTGSVGEAFPGGDMEKTRGDFLFC